MKKVKILGKKTGLGNCIQILPYIQWMQDQGIVVYTDRKEIEVLVGAKYTDKPFTENIAVYGYDLIKYLPYLSKVHGFKYRIKGKEIGLGLKTSVAFDYNIPEIINNGILFSKIFNQDISFDNYRDIPKATKDRKVVLAFSSKYHKVLSKSFIERLCYFLTLKGYYIYLVDHNPNILSFNYVNTPEFIDLVNVLRDAKYCIGADTGVTHLSEYLGIKTLKLFGATSPFKNIVNASAYSLGKHCSPCYDHGRYGCDKFFCNDYEFNDDLIKFLEEWLKS